MFFSHFLPLICRHVIKIYVVYYACWFVFHVYAFYSTIQFIKWNYKIFFVHIYYIRILLLAKFTLTLLEKYNNNNYSIKYLYYQIIAKKTQWNSYCFFFFLQVATYVSTTVMIVATSASPNIYFWFDLFFLFWLSIKIKSILLITVCKNHRYKNCILYSIISWCSTFFKNAFHVSQKFEWWISFNSCDVHVVNVSYSIYLILILV